MFINTYIWEKLLIVRLFWASSGLGLASGLQRRVAGAGDRTGAGAGASHMGATQNHRAD